MKQLISFAIAALSLTACSGFEMPFRKTAQGPENVVPVVQPDPEVVKAPSPAETAKTAEALDTTTQAQRVAALAPAENGARVLGRTIISLGSPTEPGFWLKTPLVSIETAGTVTHPGTGKSATVTLIPIEGDASAGSRMSLPAMRLIGASLTDLTEVEVAVAG